ncbi:MAG: type II toxin-antitoxin system RelE/ParE family toxin, partial [Gammaproteobacteria bacterium]|nr:type II toxin-antitoxin system RelE/ParE family toxin [Gammaproteobacteria bacterium]
HSLAEKIILRIEAAANHPYSNRSVPEKNDETIREIVLSPYRLIYTLEEGQQVMYVARIWHASRGIPKI